MGLSFTTGDNKYHFAFVRSDHATQHVFDASLSNLINNTAGNSDNIGFPTGEPVWEVLGQVATSTTFTILVRTIHNQVWSNTLTFGGAYGGWTQWSANYGIGP